MKKSCFAFICLALLLIPIAFTTQTVLADKGEYKDRGKYIYDEADRLPLESELALASYLWRIDAKSDYEIIVVFPKEKLDEEIMIKWFNDRGVGKKEKDTGAAIFVFPDNSVFVAIGSGNDLVSVAASKTYGEKILKDLDKDPVLSLLRFTNALAGKITEPVTEEKNEGFGGFVKENLYLFLLWALVLSLLAFLIQQKNGFQKTDLIAPIILLVFAGIFVGISFTGGGESTTAKEYGIITSTEHDTHHWVQMVVISTGKTTMVVPVHHTDYINRVTILSYDFRSYEYEFRTTDYKGAWEHEAGEIDCLEVNQKNGDLYSAYQFDDNSGGKTIGDGVWINKK